MRLAVLLLLTAATQLSHAQEYVLPGSLQRDTSLAELKSRFGAEHVVVATLDGAEGETFEGVVLFPDDPARRAEIIPAGPHAGEGVAAVRVRGVGSRWKLDTGVHPGMTLEALVALNGKPVRYSGLDWDYGGAIQDWHGGKLEPDAQAAVYRSLTLTHADDAPDGSYPLGDAEFRSDDPKFPQQGRVVYVGEIVVSFLDPGPSEDAGENEAD